MHSKPAIVHNILPFQSTVTLAIFSPKQSRLFKMYSAHISAFHISQFHPLLSPDPISTPATDPFVYSKHIHSFSILHSSSQHRAYPSPRTMHLSYG